MHFNSKLHYGVRALFEIALGSEDRGVFQKEIAVRQEISNKYLDQIMAALKAKGLIRNFKGQKSGYILNIAPEKLTLYEVYTAFEPEIKVMDCLTTGYECERMKVCALHIFCEKINAQLINSMKSVTLKDLLEGKVNLDVNKSIGH